MDASAKEILDFWFVQSDKEKWFNGGNEFDELIKKKFHTLYERAVKGELEGWMSDAKESLALIILIDQFSRNMFRDSDKMFAHDDIALTCCKLGLRNHYIDQLDGAERLFFMMPLIHSESLTDQIIALNTLEKHYKDNESYETSKKFYDRHKEIIEKFGRFPYRNKVLNRESTPEEIEFLKEPFSSF